MLKNSKPYSAYKKEFYINLRKEDAQIEPNADGNNYKFSWNIKNINLSRRAKIGVIGVCDDAALNGFLPIYVIRCPQVQNNSYDTAGSLPPIIYLRNAINSVINPEFYPLSTPNLDRIELYLSDEIFNANGFYAVDNNLQFYIQLKVYDYDVEEVDEALMPRYTSQSLSYNPHPMFPM